MTEVVPEQEIRSAKELRAWLRHRVRRRGSRSLFRLVYDYYDSALGLGMIVGLVTEALIRVTGKPAVRPPVGHAAAAIEWIVVLVAAAITVASVKAALALGPVVARSATQTWVLASPIDRRSLLAARCGWLVVAAACGGALVAGCLTAVRSAWGAHLPWTATLGACVGAAAVAGAVLVQAQRTYVRTAQRISDGILALLVVSAAAGTAMASLGWAPPLISASLPAFALASFPAAVFAVALASRALSRLDRAALSTGAEIANSAAAATSWLEPSLLSATLQLRRCRNVGRVRSQRIHGGRALALLRAELARLRRRPSAVFVWCALLIVPAMAGVVFSRVVIAPVHVVAAFLAADRLAGGLRTVCRSAALRRSLGGSDWELHLIHLVVPAVGTVLWTALTAAALPALPLSCAALSAVGALAVVYRIATRPPMDYTSPLVDVGFGPVPVNLVRQVARGPALLIVLCALQVTIASS